MILLGLLVRPELLGLKKADSVFVRAQFPKGVDSSKVESLLVALRGELLSLGIFSEVNLTPIRKDSELTILAEFKEASAFWVYPTLGYDDVSGWTGGLFGGLGNLLGRAHRWGAGFTLGGYNSLQVRGSRPPSRGEPWGYRAKAWWGERRWALEGALQRGWSAELTPLLRWPLSWGLWLYWEEFRFSGDSWPGPDSSRFGAAGLVLEESHLDDPAYPSCGKSLKFKAYLASAGFSGLSVGITQIKRLPFGAFWASLKIDAQSDRTPYHWALEVGGVHGLRSYPYPTAKALSRAIGSVYLRVPFFKGHWPFEWGLDLAPFLETSAWGRGEVAGAWGWGGGLELGGFSRQTGFGAVWVSVNREGKFVFGTRIGAGI